MTDEKLAEYYTEFYGFGSDFNNITSYEANQAIEQACLRALKAGRSANKGEVYELKKKISKLQELLTDCLFYCNHIDPYYHEWLEEDAIFTRAKELGVNYETVKNTVSVKLDKTP